MGETGPDILKQAIVQKGPHKGVIKNPLTAQEEANSMLELVGRASSDGYKIDRKAKRVLNEHKHDYVLTAQAEKTVHAEKEALTDYLTGALSRKAILREIETAVAEVDRRGGQVHVIFADVNSFKQFNDRYGHKTGDNALRIFVKTARRHIRRNDEIGRYGGDEFILVLQNGESEPTERIMENINGSFDMLKSPYNTLRSTMGVATYRSGTGSLPPQDLVHRADQAFLVAKRNHMETPLTWNSSMANIIVPK